MTGSGNRSRFARMAALNISIDTVTNNKGAFACDEHRPTDD